MSAMNNGSNILAAVGGLALTVSMVGIQLAHMILPQYHHEVLPPPPTAVHGQAIHPPRSTVHTTVHTPDTLIHAPRATSAAPVATMPVATATIAPQAPATLAVPSEQANPVVMGDLATYTSQNPPYSISYPTSWQVTPSSNSYEVASSDDNAGVGVYVVASGMVDSSRLQGTLANSLPMFLQEYGGSETSTPQFQYATVDGVTAGVCAFSVTKNGVSGVGTVSAVYNAGEMYYVWGVVANQTSADAAQELSQVQTIMNSFHLH